MTVIVGVAILCAARADAADTCDLAAEVAKRAHAEFSRSRADGLKLFIKAQQLCPENAAYDYNLGVAYYQYGRLSEAQTYLEKAVQKNPDNGIWLNNLAGILLAQGNGEKALETAEKAFKLTPLPQTADTLARARLAAGNFWEALSTLCSARQKWEKTGQLEQTYEIALDEYLAHCLDRIKAGETREGLNGLKKVDFDARGVRAYCLALASAGQGDQAIEAAQDAASRFAELSDTVDELMDRRIRSFYQMFKNGQPSDATSQAKAFKEKFPESRQAETAFNDLLDAFLADTATIEVPKPVQSKKQVVSHTGRTESLLAELSGNAAGTAEQDMDLVVDIEKNIPLGRISRKYGVAVVIGNCRYKREQLGINNVTYAERDAAVMKKYLVTTMGFDPKNIIYEINVTSGGFRNIFGSKENPQGMLHNYVRPGESEVFIYYAGHGAPGPDGKTAYLVPVDARADYIQNNGYDLDLFYRILAALPARDITVVLDACFSGDSAAGPLFTKISPAMMKTVNPIRDIADAVIFTGAGRNQVCTWYPEKRHSLFTYFFLKGLGGAADQDRNQSITASELAVYLEKEVPYWANRESNRKQTPLVKGRTDMVLAEFR